MGIMNVTPDSFSGDGLLAKEDYVGAALRLATDMRAAGASILDVGGESSRPGADRVSVEEEQRRVVPVIAALKKKFPDLIMAIDTVKAAVAEAALDAGASIVNDITALERDGAMTALVSRRGCYVVLMHNRSRADAVTQDARIGGEYVAPVTGDIIADVTRDLKARAVLAEKAGIARDRILLDPGLGFGKTVEQNLALVGHTDRLAALGYPLLTGPSRKSFIGRVLDLPVDQRLEGTAALVAIAAFQGAAILRVHDIQIMARIGVMAHAVRRSALENKG